MRSTFILSIFAGLLLAGSGCANSEVRVVGDRPADVYVNRKPDTIRGLLKDVIKETVGIDAPVKYAGRTVKDPTTGNYVLRYEFDDTPENGAEIQVLAQDGRVWDYKVFFDRGEKALLYY